MILGSNKVTVFVTNNASGYMSFLRTLAANLEVRHQDTCPFNQNKNKNEITLAPIMRVLKIFNFIY